MRLVRLGTLLLVSHAVIVIFSVQYLLGGLPNKPLGPWVPMPTWRRARGCDKEVTDALAAVDPLSALDDIADHPPPLGASHYARLFGHEPFDEYGLAPWRLHVIPTGEMNRRHLFMERTAHARLVGTSHATSETADASRRADDWNIRAAQATDRCDLELTRETRGAQKGVVDEIVWVSALLDIFDRDDKDNRPGPPLAGGRDDTRAGRRGLPGGICVRCDVCALRTALGGEPGHQPVAPTGRTCSSLRPLQHHSGPRLQDGDLRPAGIRGAPPH